jgi:integrase
VVAAQVQRAGDACLVDVQGAGGVEEVPPEGFRGGSLVAGQFQREQPVQVPRHLGHEQADTTQIYLHADLALKERALVRTKPPDARPGRYRPPDKLLAFLEAL